MSRTVVAVVLTLLLILAVLALFPAHARSDQPVAASAVPAGEFIEVTPGATEGIGVQAGRDRKPSQPARSTPSPSVRAVPSVAPVRLAARTSPASVTGSLSGAASWFKSPIGVSAAGPALRAAIGAGWRGTRVRVTGPAGAAWTVLGDFMARDRLVDLDVSIFPKACGALWLGLCEVEVTW